MGLEDIDDNVDEIGISMVTIKDVKYARKLGIQKLPCVGLFRFSIFQKIFSDNDKIVSGTVTSRLSLVT